MDPAITAAGRSPRGSAGARRARTALVPLALLAALTAVVFAPVLHHGFAQIDDAQYVAENPSVLRGLSLAGLRWALTSVGYAGNWHPLTWLSHQLDVQFFGLAAGRHHLTSLLLHAANALLLCLVLAAATGARWRSALVAALFAVHPLHVESVAWIAERKDVLCALLSLLALGAWLRFARRPSPGRYALAALCLALALAAKPMAVTLPFVLLLLDFWPLGRWVPGAPARPGGRTLAAVLAEKAPLLALAAASAALTVVAQSRSGYIVAAATYPFAVRLANAAWSVAAYLRDTLWPGTLAVFYPHPGAALAPASWIGAAALLAAATAGALRGWRRRPWLAAGWLWFLGMLVPVIGLVQVGDQGRADRYTYLPLVGVFVAAAWSLPERATRTRRGRAIAAAAAVAIVGALAAAARVQLGFWRDDLSLFSRAVAVTTDNWQAHAALGSILARDGRLPEAIAQHRRALAIRPDYAEGYNNLGVAYAAAGDLDAAVASYRRALLLRPDYPEACCNLGVDLAARGETAPAIESLRTAVALRPDYVNAHLQLGRVLGQAGRWAEAAREFAAVLALQPGHPQASAALRVARAAAGAR
jgi:Flp pilus assembly protein TadD